MANGVPSSEAFSNFGIIHPIFSVPFLKNLSKMHLICFTFQKCFTSQAWQFLLSVGIRKILLDGINKMYLL